MPQDDPFEVLGVPRGASPDDVAAAYRTAAKRFHPDVAGTDVRAAERMAQINAAYEAIRSGAAGTAADPLHGGPDAAAARSAEQPVVQGGWVPEPTRRALGRELLATLAPEEPVRLVADTATWASPSARLVATDRRLIWLHDDAVTHRVRSLRFSDVARVEQRLQWPRRRRAELRVRTTAGRRLSFTDLDPEIAARFADVIRVGSRA